MTNYGEQERFYNNLQAQKNEDEAWNKLPQKTFDLVDEMMWEDLTVFESLESAGLENKDFDTVPSAQKSYYDGEN